MTRESILPSTPPPLVTLVRSRVDGPFEPWRQFAKRHPLQKGVDYKLVDEIMKSDPEFVRAARSSYLQSEVARRTKDLADDKNFATSRAWDAASLGLMRLMYRDDSAKLKSIERELKFLSRAPRVNRISEDQIEFGRKFPLTRLLDIVAGKKILCPNHPDENASCMIYEDHAHCFVCGFHADSIGWLLKTQGLSFIDAVKALL